MDEKLIVEIAGDASKYAKMLDEAKAKTESSGEAISSAVDKSTSKTSESFEKAVEIAARYAQKIRELEEELDKLKDKKARVADEADKLGDKILNIGKRVENLGRQAKQAGEALSTLTAGVSLQETFEVFSRQEKAEKLLESALRSQKQNVRALSNEYKNYAKEIQSVTTYGDQLVLELVQQATSFGLNEHQTKRAIQGAIGLAEATGRSTREVIKATVKLEAGSTEMLQEYMPTLLKITDKTEKVAKAHELLGQMFDIARDSAKTSAGTLKQLENSWTDLKEVIGKVIAERLEPVIKIMKDLSDLFQSLPSWVKEAIATFLILITTTGLVLTTVGALIVAFGTLGVALEGIIGRSAILTTGMMALKGVLIAGVAYAAYQAGKAISNVDEEMRHFNDTMEKSKELNDKWANRFTDATSKIMKDIQDIDSRSGKAKFLSDQLKTAQKELEGYQQALKGSEQEVEELNTRWNRWRGNKILEVAMKSVEDFKRKLDAAKIRVDLLREALEKINDVLLDLSLKSDIKKLRDEFKLQSDTVRMTSDELKIYQLVLRGATYEMLQAAVAAKKLKDHTSELNKELVELKKNTENVQFDLDTQGLTKTERELFKLNREYERLAYQQKVNKDLQTIDNQLALDAFRTRINNYEALLKKQDAINKKNEQMKRGMEIMRHLDPVEEYRVSVNELEELLSAGAINWSTYNKGVEQAKKKFDDAVLSSIKLKESLGNLNAAKFGSAEAQDRIDKFNESLRNQKEQYKELSKQRERLNKLSFDKIPKDFKENPFFKDIGKDIGTGLGSGIGDFFKQANKITDKLFPESPLVFPENPLGLKNNAPFDRSELNGVVIENIKGMIKDLYNKILPDPIMGEIEKLQQRNLTSPELGERLFPAIPPKTPTSDNNFPKLYQQQGILEGLNKPMSEVNRLPNFDKTNSILEDNIQKLYQRQYGIPETTPKAPSRSDLDAANDRKESNKYLSNIDKTLVAINKKPASSLGTVNIEE